MEKKIEQLNHLANPKLAGYLMYDPKTTILYSVDGKNDERGPVEPATENVIAFCKLRSGHLKSFK